jgi:hypothetical protein
MPASRRASSKLVSFSLCLPDPFVRKILVGVYVFTSFPLLSFDPANRSRMRG